MTSPRFRAGDRVQSTLDASFTGTVAKAWRVGPGWFYQVRRDEGNDHDWCGAEDSAVEAER